MKGLFAVLAVAVFLVAFSGLALAGEYNIKVVAAESGAAMPGVLVQFMELKGITSASTGSYLTDNEGYVNVQTWNPEAAITVSKPMGFGPKTEIVKPGRTVLEL